MPANLAARVATSPVVIVLTGIPASGKSTVAELLARDAERGVHVRGDVFRRMVVAGRADMTPNPSDEALRQLSLRYDLTAATADRYADDGFDVVVQDVVLGQQLRPYLARFRTRPLHLVVLVPRPEVVVEREAGRAKVAYGNRWTPSALQLGLERGTPRLGLWLDSSDLTAAETAEAIRRRFGDAVVT
jgi:chloramphenicol 3-O-phosphotransferase